MTRRDALTFIVALGVSLAVGEIAVRHFLPRPGWHAFAVSRYGFLVRDSLRDYAHAPNFRRRFVTPDHAAEFQTDSLGLRVSDDDPGPPARVRILAVGDSYTEGLGVEARQAWAKRFEALVPGSHAYNAGVRGYSLTQIRRTTEWLVPILRPHLIVLGLYGHSYYRIKDPYVPVGDGASLIARSWVSRVRLRPHGVQLPAFPTPFWRDVTYWIDEHSYLAGHVVHVLANLWHKLREPPPVPERRSEREVLREWFVPMLDELLAFQRYADSLSVPLAVLLINPQSADGGFTTTQLIYNEIISGFAAQHGICFVDPVPAFVRAAAGRPVFRFRDDVHWSPAAHALAARELVRVVRDSAPTGACRAAGAVVRGKG